jgi:hypothetical protein
MKYFTLEGDYLSAYQFCLQRGGQMFPGNGIDSANVVLIGKQCFTFWKQGSKRKQEVEALSNYFGIDPEAQTGGRIARWVVEDLLSLPYQKTFWTKNYRSLARSGKHWHYLHCDTNQQFWGVEIDLKAAYFSSLFTFKSLLFNPMMGYLNDNNAMENLKTLFPDLPKWFRLQLLGCLASWRITYLSRGKQGNDCKELEVKCRYFIKYNAAFNTAHRAILRNYKLMEKIHKIGGKYIRRIHTDSFLLDCDTPIGVEESLFNYLKEKQGTYSIKGFGRCFFWDVNTGFLGNRFVGASVDVVDRMRGQSIKMVNKEKNETALYHSHYFVENPKELLESLRKRDEEIKEESEQLTLFNTNAFRSNWRS